MEATKKSHSGQSYIEILMTAIPMVTISLTTIVANGAILTMFLTRYGLRRCKNMYIASLAVADFGVGLCMPYKMTRDIFRSWDSGVECRIYQAVRQSFMYASFLSILLLTVDKWRAIHHPQSHNNRQQAKRIAIGSITFVWIISFLIFSASQSWWKEDDISGSSEVGSTNVLNLEINPRRSSKNIHFNESPRFNSTSSNVIKRMNNNRKDKPAFSNGRLTINGESESYQFGICPEGYHLDFQMSLFSTTFFYIVPTLIMLILTLSLYFKLQSLKSVEVQRSESVTDTYFMTLKKPGHELDNCIHPCGEEDTGLDSLLKTSEGKIINKHLALVSARAERRHSSLPAVPTGPLITGRTASGRRVSMPEGNLGIGCRYVGRKWSACSQGLAANQSHNPNQMANLAPRHEAVVHDYLVLQDRKAVKCLGMMLFALILCWLPHSVVSCINSRCRCLYGGPIIATSWFFMLDHAVNPFMYGLMHTQYKNVIKQWFLIERVHAFKMRDTLILRSLEKKYECEEMNIDKSQASFARSEYDIDKRCSISDKFAL